MFNKDSGNGSALIAANSIANAILCVREIKQSKKTSGRYLDVELTIAGGPFEKRKVFTMICDPFDKRNSDKWIEMGVSTLTRILHSTGHFSEADESSYSRFTDIKQMAIAMQGSKQTIKIGVEKGQDGHEDKNTVLEFGCPIKGKGGYPVWAKLNAVEPEAQAPTQETVWAGAVPAVVPTVAPEPEQPPTPTGAPSWLTAPK